MIEASLNRWQRKVLIGAIFPAKVKGGEGWVKGEANPSPTQPTVSQKVICKR